MKLSIHQPQYFPWPGYIQKILYSDSFVYLDSVSFSKNGFQNRNQIKGPDGASWISIPVRHATGNPIFQTEINGNDWKSKHWKTISMHYGKSPGFAEWKSELENLFTQNYTTLDQIAIASTEWILQKLGVECSRVRSSELGEFEEKKSELVAAICHKMNAKIYLSGAGGQDYMSRSDFDKIGTEVWFQKIKLIEYPQQYSKVGFTPGLSTLDLLLNCPETARDMLLSNCDWDKVWP